MPKYISKLSAPFLEGLLCCGGFLCMSFPAGQSWKSLTLMCPMRLLIFFPRLTTCAKYIEAKNNRGPSREGPLSRASLRPQLFCEFYLQPVYRQAFTRFQQVLFFPAHFHGRCFARPSFLLAYASPASSDATIEGSINSEPCA
jgi:hypothetical protein